MNILLLGSGGREHALAWKLRQSSLASRIFVAPGNGGTATEPNVVNVAIQSSDIDGLLTFARQQAIDLVLIGPEAPLVAGAADFFHDAGFQCLGPHRAAAALEGSKLFAKDFLNRYHIPTAAHRSFTELEPALSYVRTHGAPVVIKADGLAAGKGVILAHDLATAEHAITAMLHDHRFGAAGHTIIIEDWLQGEEASFMVLVDGEHIIPLATTQDHKARDNGDQGPNTGGMGAYSPAPVITPQCHEHIMRDIIEPTVAGLRAEGSPYQGFLYAGLMITADGRAQVLEYNCRLGDPETQPLLMRLQADLVELCLLAVTGRLNEAKIAWDPRPALGVVVAAEGYPDAYRSGDVITGLTAAQQQGCQVFHAGTQWQDDVLVSAGGRVMCVTALADTFAAAQTNVYNALQHINLSGSFYRTDIGYRALDRDDHC
jgi:phosphoribosylamine--glycine ligase